MQQLGADYTLDYQHTDIGAAVKAMVPEGVNLIFDGASGETLKQALPALKPAGKLVSILNHSKGLDPAINFQYVFVEPNSTQLEHLRQLANTGQLKVHVSQTFSLDAAAEALKQIQTKHPTGKIVIVP